MQLFQLLNLKIVFDYRYLIAYGYADLFGQKTVHSAEEELNFHRECLEQLNSISGVLTVVTRHPRVMYEEMKRDLGECGFENVRLSPFTGMMLLPYIDLFVQGDLSEFNVHAAFNGIESVGTVPTRKKSRAFNEDYWKFWAQKWNLEIQLLKNHREVADVIKRRLEICEPRGPFSALSDARRQKLREQCRLIVGDAVPSGECNCDSKGRC